MEERLTTDIRKLSSMFEGKTAKEINNAAAELARKKEALENERVDDETLEAYTAAFNFLCELRDQASRQEGEFTDYPQRGIDSAAMQQKYKLEPLGYGLFRKRDGGDKK